MNAIETNGLTKYYGAHRGIEDLFLTVEQGDFMGFVGPNGAGKSTTIRTLLGFISATKGSSAIFGKDTVMCRSEILSRIGYLPAEAVFYGGMRVRDILRLSADLRKKNCKEEADELCKRLELDQNRKISELSLGNRKKVSIVCTLQHRPDLYILDEPTSGLDPVMQREFYQLLTERNNDGATVFLSSHILSEIGRYCKGAAVIRDGRLLACDRVKNLSHTATKRVILHGVKEVPKLDGIRNLTVGEDSINFLYSGDVRELMRVFSGLPVTDLTVAEPDLEEVFFHYYQKEDKTV